MIGQPWLIDDIMAMVRIGGDSEKSPRGAMAIPIALSIRTRWPAAASPRISVVNRDSVPGFTGVKPPGLIRLASSRLDVFNRIDESQEIFLHFP
jgi:hypothetical protein